MTGPTSPAPARGRLRRQDRAMTDEEARAYLRERRVAHVASVDDEGWPYVVPLVYVYEGGEHLYLHTGARPGHFLANVRHAPRLCLEVSEIGDLHPGRPYACNSALVYSSVVVFGTVRIIEDRDRKTWFFDRLLEKYGDPEWEFEPGYPLIDRIVLYELAIEQLTGKRSSGLRH